MKYGCQFSVDKYEVSLHKDPEEYIVYMKRRYASELGQKLCEAIPFVKDIERSWPDGRPVPDPMKQINPERAVDIYRCDFIAFSREEWRSIKSRLRASADLIGSRSFASLLNALLQDIESGDNNPLKF